MSPHHLRVLSSLGVAVALLSACKEEKRVAQYTVPKETPAAVPTASPTGTPAMTANPELVKQTSGFVAPAWVVPAGWRAMPESPMRKGGWKNGPDAAPAEISVTVFPGDVGGLQANVGRWCGQVGLPAPETPEQLAKLTAPATVSGIQGTRVALVNAGKALTTVLVQRDGATWFFKIAGPETAVSAATGEFDVFVASVKFPESK
jgi:hypothetical protein